MKFGLCLIFLLVHPPQPKYDQLKSIDLPPVDIVSNHIIYKGYGNQAAKLFFQESGCKITTAICLAEHGGTIPSNGNVGNVRYSAEYETYSDWKQGMKELKKVLKKRRYKKCFQREPSECIQCIQQSGYSPSPEWTERVTYWYNLIK